LLKDPPQSDICYATKNRQLSVRSIAGECDIFIVVGSKNSANTNRLAEVASEAGAAKVFRVDKPEELDNADFSSATTVGISSGVSVANEQLMDIVAYLRKLGYTHEEERVAVVENDLI
jgi:4-hydroxy-3-methylbut-2-enyl diphosphate reductase